MIKIAYKREIETITNLQAEVIERVIEIAVILDESYGGTRSVEGDLGGYIFTAEVGEDIETIKGLIDFQNTLPEYVDLITCSNGERDASSLVLLSSDYSISLLIPMELTPE